jgi:hypothetical protein
MLPRKIFALLLMTVSIPSSLLALRQPIDSRFQDQVLIYVPIANPEALNTFQETGLPVYAFLHSADGAYLISEAGQLDLQALDRVGTPYRILDSAPLSGDYYLVYTLPGIEEPQWEKYGKLLLDDGLQYLMRLDPRARDSLAETGVALRALTLEAKPIGSMSPSEGRTEQLQPDPRVQEMMDQVNGLTIFNYIEGLTGDIPVQIEGEPYTITTRYTYSGEPVENATVYVGDHLASLGLDVDYHEWSVGRPNNVIGELTGEIRPEEIYILSAHLDDMPPGALAPGADDNASGSVAVLVAADILSQYRWGCTLRFALWTGEEQGLLGSYDYASDAFSAGENIAGVLNLDMIAWNTASSSPTIDIHAKASFPATMDLAFTFADVINVYHLNLIPEIVPNGTGASDHASFWTWGYPAILAIEDFSDFNPNYHTIDDSIDNLEDLPYYYEFVTASVGAFAHIADCLIDDNVGFLDGTITDVEAGTPIADVSVAITGNDGQPLLTATDASGYYTQTLISGAYTVTATSDGYVPVTVNGVAIYTDTVTTLDFGLEFPPCAPVTTTQFSWTPITPTVGQVITFTGSVTGSTPITMTWDFGDGFFGTGITSTHAYTNSEIYTVTLRAENPCSMDQIAHLLSVVPLPEPPSWQVYLPVTVRRNE